MIVRLHAVLRHTALLLAAMLLASCGPAPYDRPETTGLKGEDLFKHAEYLCLEQRWDEAIPMLKAFLVENPSHAGAHFYLGRCFMLSPEPWLAIAEGEFQTALYFFIESGRKLPIQRFNAPSYFEMMCHVETGKIYYEQLAKLFEMGGASSSAVGELIGKFRNAAEQAKKVAPEAPEVGQMEERLEELKQIELSLPQHRGSETYSI
jgi:tetratricopeptide (TPR) repeat protein